MILIPRYKDVLIEGPRLGIGLAGRFKLTKGKGDIITGETAWFNNIIVNGGLDNIANTNFNALAAYFHCGTGTTAETATDTALETFLASTSTLQSTSESAEGSAPYYGKVVVTRRFAEGAAEGNISEVAISSTAATGSIFSRTLVKDGGGSPTTITVLSDEWLDLSYEFRLYPDHIGSDGSADDGSGSIDISGSSYGYTIRPSNVTNYLSYRAYQAKAAMAAVSGYYGVAYGSDGALGAATSTPTGSSQDVIGGGSSTVDAATYSNGTYNRDISLIIGLNDGNVSGGCKALQYNTGMGAYQILFGTAVPKDATKVWTFVTNLAWARATIP